MLVLAKLAKPLCSLNVPLSGVGPMKKPYIVIFAISFAAVMLPAQAQSLSYNIGVVSLYKSNGIDQDTRAPKDLRPAIQGGVDYSFGNGFYVGNWNSTGKFGNADLEIDLYAGYATELSNGVSFDVGAASYIYPENNAGFNGTDMYLTVGYGIANFRATRGVGGSVEDLSRYSVTLSQPIAAALTARLTLGGTNKARGGHNFFAIGASYALSDGTSLTATYSGAGKNDNGNKPESHKSRLVLGVSRTF